MKLLWTLASVAFVVLATSCASDFGKYEALRNYQGEQAGFVVLGEGAEKSPMFDHSGLTFQRRGTESLWGTRYSPKRLLMPGEEPDYESKRETGKVVVMRLPPGTYDLVNAYVGQNASTHPYSCTKSLPPGISFTLNTGETVYLGRYTLTTWKGHCLQLTISEGNVADVETARSRVMNMPAGDARSAVPEQRTL